jgi:signal transduction histidine kinase
MATRAIWDTSRVSLAALTPTAAQRRLTLAVVAATIAATAMVAPFGAVQLQPMHGFIPATEFVIVTCSLLTAALLAGQALAVGSRGLLLIAGSFLFDALIIVPHALTFPGAFAPTGLFDAGLQTTAWLFVVWHLGQPAAVIGYACFKREARHVTAAMMAWGAAFVICLAALLAWIAVTHGDSLPVLFVDRVGFAPLAYQVTGFDFAVSIAALLALLWRPRKSTLDLWLTVAVAALVAELAMTTFIIPSRFSLGFYASRLLSLGASMVVLVALIAETVGLGLRLARANLALELERSRKLTTLDAALGAITHEVKQPISSIVCNAEAAEMILNQSAPDLGELRTIAGEIVDSSFRANEIFRNIRGLFKNSREDFRNVDMNQMISSIMRAVRPALHDSGVVLRIELARDLPAIFGHAGQLQEVVLNLVHNAVDAMKTSVGLPRTLRVCTTLHGRRAIGISVEDSGPGIAPGQVEHIFDPFVTTKKDGMGMGLAICRMIIERHGGQLSVSSDLDRGARFEISLPVEAAAEPVERPEEIAAAAPLQPVPRRQRQTSTVTVARGTAH